MTKTFPFILLLILISQCLIAQTQLSYLDKPKFSGIHIYQDSISKIYTIVAGSDELAPHPTFIYQLDSNFKVIAAQRIEPAGKNITASASSNRNRTIITRSVQNSTGQLTANLICLDRKLKVQWSVILDSYYIVYVNAVRIGPSGSSCIVGNGVTISPSRNYSFLCKLDPYGERDWELTDFTVGDTTAFKRLALDNQDNTYTIGSIGRKGLLTKINAEGDVEWQQSVFYRGETRLSSIAANDGFIYLLGSDEGSTAESGQVFISKLTTKGEEVWTTILGSQFYQFFPDNAIIKTASNGDLVLALNGTDLDRRCAWATVHLDQSGVVINSTFYHDDKYDSFSRDLFIGKNNNFAGIGVLATIKETIIYPFFFNSTSADLLEGQCCFTPFKTTQKSTHLEFQPVSIDFVNNVIINLNEFPVVTKEEVGVIKKLKD